MGSSLLVAYDCCVIISINSRIALAPNFGSSTPSQHPVFKIMATVPFATATGWNSLGVYVQCPFCLKTHHHRPDHRPWTGQTWVAHFGGNRAYADLTYQSLYSYEG